jgi:undecaprenyl-diphosphatase
LLRDDDSWWPIYYAVAVIVAASRVHVKIHHASDVIGGIAIGIVLGEVARGLVPVGSRGSAESRPRGGR